jgi:WD40 repeat protein
MATFQTCSRGHQWEASTEKDSAGGGGPAACPVCKELTKTVSLPPSRPREVSDFESTNPEGAPAGPGGAANSATPLVRAARSPAPPEAPAVAGYEVLGVLGRGAMGVVYLARDEQLKRLVALKMVLAGAHAGGHERERFRVEAEAVARLAHPNIVQIYDIGEQDGRPYCALEYIDGGTLAARVKDAPLPAAEAARVVETLAAAMHAAHLKGIVHRDLKPGNVLLAGGRDLPPSQCVPKIADFGLAKLLGDDTGQTRTGSVMGTPSYMAPEQAAGRNREVGPPADIYALGAVLYDLVTGRPPFKAESVMDTLQQVLSLEPAPPRRLNPKVPRDLETICLKCLEKELGRRYASAGDLADELRRFLAGEPIKARPLGALGRGVKWAKRRPALAAMTAAACAAAVAALALAGGLWYNAEKRAAAVRTLGEAEGKLLEVGGRLETAKGQVAEQEDLLRRKQKEVDATVERGKEAAWRYQYVADMLVAPAAWETNNLGRLRELLGRYEPRPGREDVRGFEWFYLWRLAHQERRTLAGPAKQINCVAVSPDGKLIAAGSVDKSVYLWDAATGANKEKLLGSTLPVTGVAFSPDGTTLAAASASGTIKLWDVATQKSLPPELSTAREPVTCVAFAPDGGSLAAATSGGTIKMWDVKSRQETRSFRAHKAGVQILAFSHDGKTLATGSIDTGVRLWDPAGGEPRAELQGHNADVTGLAFSPNDKSLATASRDGAVYVWEAATGKRRGGPFYPHRGDVTALGFTTDGKELITTGSTDRTIRLSDAATGQPRAVLKGHEGEVLCLALADEGKALVTGGKDQTVKVWDLPGAGDRTVLPTQSKAVLCVTWSPDGKTLACGGTATADGRTVGLVELWDPAQKTAVVWRGHDDSVTGVAFAPDGRTLATGSVDTTVLLWDVAKGKVRLPPLRGHDKAVSCVTFSRDGKRLASSDVNGRVVLWDLADGQEVKRLEGRPAAVRCLAFSPDGRTLAAGHFDGTVVLWDVEAGKEHGRWRAHGEAVYALAFSPDGATLATGSDDRTAKLWDWAEKQQVASFAGHEMGVRSLTFAPDGRTLVTAAGSVRFWDLATRFERAALRPEPFRALCVAFTRDGRRLAAGTSATGPIIVWDGATDEQLQAHGPK